MSTLDGPIWSRYSIALTCLARSHFQRTLSKERWSQSGMNHTAYQEKEKNVETRTGKRRGGEERKQTADFKEAVCCPSAVVQGAAEQKNEWGMPRVTGTLRKANSHFNPTQMGSGTTPPR